MALGIVPSREHRRLLEICDLLAGHLARPREVLLAQRPEVSSWSVAKQLEHTLKSTELMLRAVELILDDDPKAIEHEPGVRFIGRVVFFSGRIPRGKGRAPDSVIPPEDVDLSDMPKRLDGLRATLAELQPRLGELRARRGCFEHPYFGNLDGRRWLRLAQVHADHHLLIVDDILAAGGRAR
jgi:hypothetical protein